MKFVALLYICCFFAVYFYINCLCQEIDLTTEDSMDIVIRAVPVARVTSPSGTPTHHCLIIAAAL